MNANEPIKTHSQEALNSPSVGRSWRDIFYAVKNYGIARRLLLYIIIFSSGVTLLATSWQLYTDYQRDLDVINSRLNEIEGGYIGSISASLWNLDIKQLELQLDGIKHLPDIKAVEIQEHSEEFSKPLHLLRGEKDTRNIIVRDYPIIHNVSGEVREIGTLTIQVSLTEVYQRLWDKAIVILLSQGIKTFLVSLFTLYIFYYLVTHHLTTIARFLRNFDVEKEPQKLYLHRKSNAREDELDLVVKAFNNLSQDLHQAYENLRDTNKRLEEDNIARRKAEEEVNRLNAVLEQRVRQRTAELEAANKELGAFCYSVSHDLRAPLRRIEGFRRILSEEYRDDLGEKGRHYLSRIEAGTREMAEMIDSFLRLSRATQGEMDVQRVNISEQVTDVINRIQERESNRQITLKIEPDIFADVDKRFFEVLLTNLLDNAWKYSRHQENAKIVFGVTLLNEETVYYISDNGVGFDMAYADRLFSPFNRLHKAEEFDGVGIGLATVQRIVARHGGRIWTQSAPGEGATFYFTLWSRNKESGHGNNIVSGGQS
ncbi:MAG: ATP-binding protein [Cellvibrio sp.]|jgi:Bacteriophytochrome (light-regulated signal transduction histidine kinase)